MQMGIHIITMLETVRRCSLYPQFKIIYPVQCFLLEFVLGPIHIYSVHIDGKCQSCRYVNNLSTVHD